MLKRFTPSGWEVVTDLYVFGQPPAEGPPDSGYQVTLAEDDVTDHGAGYPLTYRFTVPTGQELTGQQWDESTQSWEALPAAPTSGRFDGIDAFRVDGTTAYLSARFPEGRDALYLRVVNNFGTEVGAFSAIESLYDARGTVLIFTYDDTRTELPEASAAHQAAGIWMSPAINSGWLDVATGINELSTVEFATAVAGGYVEPVNHTKDHMSAGDYFGDQVTADAQIIGGRDGILAVCDMPPQSRGRVHGFIYPNGASVAETFESIRRAGHLTARAATTTGYRAEPWDGIKGFYQQSATIGGFTWKGPASNIVDAVEASITAALHKYVHVYSYVHNWDWTAGSQMVTALGELAAITEVWSVGFGHHALYRRTRERATVVAL